MEVESVSVKEETRLTQMRFDAAVKVIKSLPPNGPFQPSNDMMLKFYSYYKQATIGPCNIPRPGFWDAVGKAKWDAWNSLGDMSKEEAMAAYVEQMKLILEGMPITNEVEELLRVLGPFYELVDEKKKISQISDLSTGFGTMLNSLETKSVAKSIIRNMEMNSSLESQPARLKVKEEMQQEEEEEEDDDDEEEEKEEIMEVRKASQPKKKSSTRRHKSSHLNGKLANGVTPLTNGSHTRAALNSDNSQEGSVGEPLLNGHHTGTNHLASDSDSEVYCDSVDQFGQEENSEHNRSLDDLDEESHVLLPVEELQEDAQDPPQAVRCGGEDGEAGGTHKQRLDVDMPGSSSSRRGKGSRSPGLGPGAPMLIHGGRDGDGERWKGAVTPGGSLNEQIVVALARLQEDMQSVLERLRTLEALTASQARSVALSPTYGSPPVKKKNWKPSWWPFDISPASVAFAVIWPFVVQWLFRLYLQRRRRRIN
ncbi:acyl-CoA-binding domain-containing protein 5A [Austrofundulus limnaeus]|uniref:Acyl-CoA-binding domain-containing protein 5 n=1 Tax=Austrofundulus limnaeus TaxID=52670 RepID=A0A2I4AZD4_AUSLI|nr:PREDICTED: acyl-CoA-binding domain-containing protein 5 [Austrofundulus limnaeus]XP_013860868.1 PREDICTED: acyl-CoA-binding domain-containing protein 5 [Austrofundulus limnaeus]